VPGGRSGVKPGGGGGHAAGVTARWRAFVSEPLLSVLFPPRCVGCGDFESHLCDSCRETLAAIGADSCPRCGEPGPQALVAGRCAGCMGKDLAYAGARGAFRHQGTARKLVADFKFGGQPVLGRVMADLARPAFAAYVGAIAPSDRLLVTWVPCHRTARRQRGYNQAEVLARWLACGPRPLPLAGLVRKTKATRHQKGLGRAGRQENLRGVFCLEKAGSSTLPPQTQAVVLVDDVYTTGATAREVASVLVAGVGVPVYVFTFSRAGGSAPERHD
jgi:predicted amidophosphoribosyltransferase